jgi:hypothetical protein
MEKTEKKIDAARLKEKPVQAARWSLSALETCFDAKYHCTYVNCFTKIYLYSVFIFGIVYINIYIFSLLENICTEW